jgi:hypothetical protein
LNTDKTIYVQQGSLDITKKNDLSQIRRFPPNNLEDDCKIIFLDNSFIEEKTLEVNGREVINIFSEDVLNQCFLG